jgi:outer membrane protein, heavy metal efflux system
MTNIQPSKPYRSMPHKIKLIIFSLCLLIFPSLGIANELVPLAGYLQEALKHNEEILALQAQSQAAKYKIAQSGILPDPKFGLQSYLKSVETKTGPQIASFSIAQALPWPGKLSLSRKQAGQAAAIINLRLRAVCNSVVRKVKELYVEYAFNHKAQQITAENIELIRYLEEVANTRYISGKLGYSKILKLQVELAQLLDRKSNLEDQINPLRVKLNSLLGASPNTERKQPTSLPLFTLKQNKEEIFSLAHNNSPALFEAERIINKAETGVKRARLDFYPDFVISLKTIITGELEFDSISNLSDDPVIAGVSINLPIFRNKRRAAVNEKIASVSAKRKIKYHRLRLLDANISETLFLHRDARRRHNLYKTILIPKIEQELEAAIESFQSGKVSILALIDAQSNLLQFNLAESRAVADQAKEVARLEELSGVTLVDWEGDN